MRTLEKAINGARNNSDSSDDIVISIVCFVMMPFMFVIEIGLFSLLGRGVDNFLKTLNAYQDISKINLKYSLKCCH